MGLWGKSVAWGYDWMATRIDRHGGADHRARLVGDANGDVLEVGAGTGKNLPHYRAAGRVVALEPDPDWRERAEGRADRANVPVEVVDGDGMALPFPDESFDTVVSGLVLCTIPDPRRALEEMRRVLVRGGHLVITTHGLTSVAHYATNGLRPPEQCKEIAKALYRRGWWYAPEFGSEALLAMLMPNRAPVSLPFASSMSNHRLRHTSLAKYQVISKSARCPGASTVPIGG